VHVGGDGVSGKRYRQGLLVLAFRTWKFLSQAAGLMHQSLAESCMRLGYVNVVEQPASLDKEGARLPAVPTSWRKRFNYSESKAVLAIRRLHQPTHVPVKQNCNRIKESNMTNQTRTCPMATRDEEQWSRDLDEFGFCLVADAIPEQTLESIHTRIHEQATVERTQGLTALDDVQLAGGDDGNQYVYMLLNKGKIFQELLTQPFVRSLVGHVLGDEYLLSDFAAIITHPDNRKMGMHIDQWFMPTPSEPKARGIRSGSVSRRNLLKGPPDAAEGAINPPVVCNVFWMISEFTLANGATRVVPRSQLSGCHPESNDATGAVNVTGPAGTALVFEGRTWHGADVNSSDAPRYGVSTYYCAPQIRQMANLTYGTRRDVLDEMSPELLALLGFKPWGGYGATGDPSAQQIRHGEDTLGELRP
jgi:hypothetical protein